MCLFNLYGAHNDVVAVGTQDMCLYNSRDTVGTVQKSNRKTENTTLSEQFKNLTEKQRIPHCRNSSKI
jgi:hypothetical protein